LSTGHFFDTQGWSLHTGLTVFTNMHYYSRTFSFTLVVQLSNFVSFQGAHIYSAAPKFVTFLVFGILSVIAGCLTLLLPETLNRDLPDTVREAEHLGEDVKKDFENFYEQTLNSELDEETGDEKSPERIVVNGHTVNKGLVDIAQDQDNQDMRSGTDISLHYNGRMLLKCSR
jgi:hypothetical protein